MIIRLFHADKTVGADLREALRARPGFVLATQLQGSRDSVVDKRTPLKEILESGKDKLDLLVVIDEGRPEGMWRDPFGALCDELFIERRDAATATAGYVLLRAGQPLAFFRKALWDPLEDAEEITAFLSRTAPTLFKAWTRPRPKLADPVPLRPPKPKPKKTPIVNLAAGAAPTFSAASCPTVEVPAAARAPEHLAREVGEPAETADPTVAQELRVVDPWVVLGLRRGAHLEQVKRAYRALVQQYHPDKVAHLGPEFRKLAEERTRDLNLAFALLEKELGRGG